MKTVAVIMAKAMTKPMTSRCIGGANGRTGFAPAASVAINSSVVIPLAEDIIYLPRSVP
jgi:hypothetical protein